MHTLKTGIGSRTLDVPDCAEDLRDLWVSRDLDTAGKRLLMILATYEATASKLEEVFEDAMAVMNLILNIVVDSEA